MVRKLMESFDVDAALLARFSEFDSATLFVMNTFGDSDEQLDSVEADLGIDQGWEADSKVFRGTRVDVVGHQEALAMTLRDRIEDVDDAACSGPSCCSNFSHSTGNSTNNSDAKTCQHILRAKALKSIELIDRNYMLENDLVNPGQNGHIVAQNLLLQEQLAALNQVFVEATEPSNQATVEGTEPMDATEPMGIHGGEAPGLLLSVWDGAA